MTIRGLLSKELINVGSKSKKIAYRIRTESNSVYEIRMETDKAFQNPDDSPLKHWVGLTIEAEGGFLSGYIFVTTLVRAI